MSQFTLDRLNHSRTFDPLVGGIKIVAMPADHPGTLGAIATDGAQLYLLSNYHVLCGPLNGPVPPAGTIYHPSRPPTPGNPPPQPPFQIRTIADLDIQRADATLDCAAAKLQPGVAAEPRILGIGRILGTIAPAAGMRVIKSGIRTGVTEGVITAVDNLTNVVTINAPPESPANDCSDGGDSGAVWVLRDAHLAVALHRAGAVGGVAEAVDINAVLAALNLQLYV